MAVKQLLHRIYNKLQWICQYESLSFQSLFQYYGLLLFSRQMEVSQKPTLIVSPHQDDETLGCGGLIALKRVRGIPVRVVFITDGAGSHTWHPKFKGGEIAPIRKQEACLALKFLGVEETQIDFLDEPDGKLKYMPETERQQISNRLTQILLAFNPGEVYVTHRRDRSADHEAAYMLVKAAIAASGLDIELLQYPIWIFWKTLLFRDVKPPELGGAYRVSIKPVQSQKRQAIEAYRSQYLQIEGGGGTVLPPGFLRRFFTPYEVFFK